MRQTSYRTWGWNKDIISTTWDADWDYCGTVLWQPLITKTNDYTSGKSLRVNIKWEFHKRTWQEVSA